MEVTRQAFAPVGNSPFGLSYNAVPGLIQMKGLSSVVSNPYYSRKDQWPKSKSFFSSSVQNDAIFAQAIMDITFGMSSSCFPKNRAPNDGRTEQVDREMGWQAETKVAVDCRWVVVVWRLENIRRMKMEDYWTACGLLLVEFGVVDGIRIGGMGGGGGCRWWR
jgi:hypothetical protein